MGSLIRRRGRDVTGAEVERFMKMLGNDSDSIAQTLRSCNVKGSVGSASSCPLANYFRESFPDVMPISVSREGAIVGDVHVRLRSEHSAFVSRFDHGEFPDLQKSNNW